MLDRPSKTKVAALDAQSRLVQALQDQRALMLMDNCEHLIGAAAALIDHLLARCPQLRILVTSREPLGIVGETLCVIPPLEHPAGDGELSPSDALAYPAVRLFADRAASVRRGFTVEHANVARVAEICRRLDGLPLAIELAAARLRSLSIDQIADRLDDRFRLLTGGNRAALPRQRTLRAVVEWSWDLLSPPERLVAENLAVFPGGITLGAAEAVCASVGASADDVVDLLAALVDKSLLQLNDDVNPRYRMLETIREFGVERLAERGELLRAQDAHARHFAAFAAEAEPHLRASEQLGWLARLEVEKGNFLAALRFLADQGDASASLEMVLHLSMMWMLQGRHEEFASWSEVALSARGEAPPLLRAIVEVLHALNFAITTGQFDVAGGAMEQVKPIVMDDGSDEFLLLPFVQGLVMMFSDDADGAREVIERHRNHREPWVRAGLHLLEAGLAENVGDIDRQTASAAVALAAFRAIGDRWGCAGALTELASARKVDGDLDGAIEAYEESMRYARELGSKGDIAETMLKLVDVRVRQGDLQRAEADIADVQRALDADPGLFPGFARLFIDVTLGWLRICTGDLDAGRGLFAQALDRYRREGAGNPKQLGVVVLGANAELAIDDGDLVRARELLEEAHELALEAHDMPVIGDFGRVLAQYAVVIGRAADGAEMLGAADRLRGRPDATHPRRGPLIKQLQAALGDEAFEASYAAGAAMAAEAAIARLDLAALAAEPS
jgi:predicted ATPase